MNNEVNNHTRFAVMEAMDKQHAFSWIKGRNKGEVQAGVYLKWSQELFQTLSKRLELVIT